MSLTQSLPATEIARHVRAGGLLAHDVVAESLRACDAARELNAFISVTPQAVPATRSGRLAGVPIAIKDMFELAGTRTTYGSRLFAEHISDTTAIAVQRLVNAGASIVGKTNLHEFAWGLTSQNERWGDVRNPRYPTYTPGGSSGGSAAAVAAHLVPIALGTDTGGSIRVPAACCGVVGYKPSYGLLPTAGVRPLAPSFDTIGPIANSVLDCLLAVECLLGRPLVLPPADRLKIAVEADAGIDSLLSDLNVTARETNLQPPEPSPSICFLAESAFTHRTTFPRFADQYGGDARRKWRTANKVSAADYLASRAALSRWRRSMRRVGYDVFVSRTLGLPLPRATVDERRIRQAFGRRTRLANFLGWASLAYGDLLISGPRDETVFAFAARLEAEQLPILPPIFDQVP
jgi:Asp-tRNA(Asn)/Glu-tRNA(Gln) amidotransferase A subunit family amidase